jgi:acyl-coenzyme A synthetase/AMP-(fatty) acid ligase
MALPALRLMTQAGGALDADEVRWLAQLAAEQQRQLFIMYGQTEATARIACLAPERAQAKPGSIGQAIAGGTLALRDSGGKTVEGAGVEGELEYRGPNVMLGYAQTRADLALGRCTDLLRTGDLGWRDADGDYWISGRRQRFIKLFGHRCALDEVDRQLRAFGLDAAATGRDDRLMVGLVGSAAQAQALRERLSLLYRVHASAVVVRPLAALPRNGAGKLLQAELLARLDAPLDEVPA